MTRWRITAGAVLLVAILCAVWAVIAFRGDQRTAKKYFYGGTEAVMLIEESVSGRLDRSRWYDREGAVLKETLWDANGSGVAYKIHDDGWIERELPVRVGLVHGTVKFFDSTGEVIATQEFKEGVEAGPKQERPHAQQVGEAGK